MLGEEEQFGTQMLGLDGKIKGYVVISGDKRGEVKIWWDGGSAITCSQSHVSPVRELRIYGCQVKLKNCDKFMPMKDNKKIRF